jgi:hypothetical protein
MLSVLHLQQRHYSSRRNSDSGTTKSVRPQPMQTRTVGNTQPVARSEFSIRGSGGLRQRSSSRRRKPYSCTPSASRPYRHNRLWRRPNYFVCPTLVLALPNGMLTRRNPRLPGKRVRLLKRSALYLLTPVAGDSYAQEDRSIAYQCSAR